MSKDKDGKNVKKAASTASKKAPSDYQNGKKSLSIESSSLSKKK